MKHSITRLYAVVLTVVVIVALAAGYAAGQGAAGQVPPFVVNIAQDVPLTVDASVQLDSGDTVTVTVPLTVGVELRIRVDGPTVETLPASEPVIAVATAAPRPVTVGGIVLDAVQWRLMDAFDTGQTFDYFGQQPDRNWEHTDAKYVALRFDVLNNGAAPVNLADFLVGRGDYTPQLSDDQERRFGKADLYWTWNEGCDYSDLNPGINTTCTIVFELPTDASGLIFRFAGDADKQAIAVEPQSYE
jgi:hypothetical protein